MNDEPAQGFEPEETPTHPSAPAPEELAMQTWLASASRAIRGPMRSPTSRFRAVAVAAVEGGIGRVSHVDLMEAAAESAALDESGTRPVVVAREEAPAPAAEPEAPAPEAPPVAIPAPAEVAVAAEAPAEPAPEAPAEPAPEAPAEPAPAARRGPRGTVRLAPRAERGPTGTVLMPARPAVRAARDEARAARARWLVVLGIGLLCALDVAWVATHERPAPLPPPIVTTAPQVTAPAALQPATTADPAPRAATAPGAPAAMEETDPPATASMESSPAEPSTVATSAPAPHPVAAPARRVDPRRKRATPATVF